VVARWWDANSDRATTHNSDRDELGENDGSTWVGEPGSDADDSTGRVGGILGAIASHIIIEP